MSVDVLAGDGNAAVVGVRSHKPEAGSGVTSHCSLRSIPYRATPNLDVMPPFAESILHFTRSGSRAPAAAAAADSGNSWRAASPLALAQPLLKARVSGVTRPGRARALTLSALDQSLLAKGGRDLDYTGLLPPEPRRQRGGCGGSVLTMSRPRRNVPMLLATLKECARREGVSDVLLLENNGCG